MSDRRFGISRGEDIRVRGIVQANIDRFNDLLKITADPTKRAMIISLCAEEKEKLKLNPEDKKPPFKY